MKKLLLKGLLCVSAFLFVFNTNTMAQKPWTVLMYIAAANDLNPFALYDLQEMIQVGSNEKLNILAYVTYQQSGQEKTTQKFYVESGKLTQIGEVMVMDSGDPATLKDALEWACIDYPSDRIAVVLWDHGSGSLNRSQLMNPRGVCYDYDTGSYLSDIDCLQAFAWARDMLRGGRKFDIIAMDACLMATLEIAYTLASCANYLVASEETIPGDGFQYAYMLSPLKSVSLSGLDFAKHMINAYKQEYQGTMGYTLSATDLSAISSLVSSTNEIAQMLTKQLTGLSKLSVKSVIRKCLTNCPSFDSGTYVDLLQFYKNLLTNSSSLRFSSADLTRFKQLLNQSISAFANVIKANVTSTDYYRAGGLTMYFAQYSVDSSYKNLYWTQNNPQWLNFLKAYVALI